MSEISNITFGKSKDVLSGKPSSPLGDLLTKITEDTIKRLQDRMEARDVNTSSLGLSQSVVPTEVEIKDGAIEVGINMAHYWKYVNYGVNGSEISWGAPNWGTSNVPQEQSFHQAILEWIPQRGISLPESFESYESFAYAIMKNKIKTGQEPKPFYDDVINEKLEKQMRKPIEELIGKSIEINITANFN